MSLTMADTPASVEQNLEELKRQEAARVSLADRNVDAAHVYRSWAAYESDMVGPSGRSADVVVFLDSERRPRTAVICGDDVAVLFGWPGDHRTPRTRLPDDPE